MNHDDLLGGIGHVQYEWTQMGGCAARLELVDGIRTPGENATLESLLVHVRCLVNFLCGNYEGKWSRKDMKPADFVRATWVLPDGEMDRRQRGRLTVIKVARASELGARDQPCWGHVADWASRARGSLVDAPVRRRCRSSEGFVGRVVVCSGR